MVTRILPREDYGRLVGTELEAVAPILKPDDQVVVVEDGDRIVGCWALMPFYHVEGVWIHPDYRKRATVAGRLLAGMRALCRSVNVSRVITTAVTSDVERLVAHLGGERLPGASFVVGME